MQELLGSLDIFSALNKDDLLKLGVIAREIEFKDGALIVEEGKHTDYLYIVNNGTVRVTKGKELNISLGRGSLIGELSFIDKGLPSANVKAENNVTLVVINFADFDKLITQDKEFAYKIHTAFLRSICKKLRDSNDWIMKKGLFPEMKEKSRIAYVF